MSHRGGSCRKINHEDSPPLFSIQEIMIHPAQIALIAFAVLTSTVAQAAEVDFVRDVRPILQQHCYACHGEEKQKSGLRLDIKSEAFKGGDSYGPSVVAGEIEESPLLEMVQSEDEDLRMPPEGGGLSATEIATLTRWVKQGARWPDGVDLAKLEDRTDHWSFKPVTHPVVPKTQNNTWPINEIDRFILARLEQQDISPAGEANRLSWLRRVYFDLIGLPPSPVQVDQFLNDQREDAYQQVVDELLQSPRYGERWAQHWLDVVRYADTHGFEVNTPRPNAWPYRDYVIQAFNNDTPYNQFIHEQLAGDAMNQDAGTGFLVTAAVLLPGQIGKDEPSKRLAHQDSLDEILINTGEAFLGLSIGCARCHDHKFDPITQRDYYAMQAFFSGVRYGDRPIQSADHTAQQKKVKTLTKRLDIFERQLARFEPLAQVGVKAKVTDSKLNEENFAPLRAKYVRFTVHDANLHPKLGLIEPCIDEFEIFTVEESPRNVALAELGTQVTASGSRTSSNHKLEHINDGQYGNSRSWMSDEAGRGWVLFVLPEATNINKIVWSRDRKGDYDDRLATAYSIEAGLTPDTMQRIVNVPPPRAMVSAKRNVDRFKPVTTQTLRFSVQQTNSLEPSIDELEVLNVDGKNVALASLGTRVTSSGNRIPSDKHKLEYLNDGLYGNSHDWISNEQGQGWVELTFAQPQTIDRVIWSRDREGKFTDRLSLEYTIEVIDEQGARQIVANSDDRLLWDKDKKQPVSFSTAGLSEAEAHVAQDLFAKISIVKKQITAAKRTPMVYAGIFTEPEPTHLLYRGDPEQPLEELAPAVIQSLGKLQLPKEPTEQQRRQALASWIANPENPLTARVMVNRIWQGHFGRGMVDTSSDFGRSGAKPSHPELLDWLATRFVDSGWSIKQMHRLIVLSATYRQSSQIAPKAQEVDSDVRLLWRFPSRRLEAEAIRDSMIAVSGRLNLKTGGPGFDLFKSRGGLSGFPPVTSFDEKGLRRMIYAHKIRMEREVVFGAFDCPDAGQSTARRRQSTTPIQALNLFNSRFTLDEADAFAAKVLTDVGEENRDDLSQQIRLVYRLALGREPNSIELNDALPVVQEHGLSTLCRVMFNSNEFLFLP